MTKKVMEYIDLAVGFMDLRKTMSLDEAEDDDRITAYFRNTRTLLGGMAEDELGFLDKVPAAVDVSGKAFAAMENMRAIGNIDPWLKL